MNQAVKKVQSNYLKKVPELRPGDVVRVHQKIKEGAKERIQVFEGVVLRVKGGGISQSFLVRKISYGIGVEKNFLIHSPNISKVEVKKRAKVRKAYLSYLRNLQGKSARLKDKQFDMLAVNVKDESEEIEAAKEGEKDEAEKDKEVTELSEEEIEDAEKEEVPLEVLEKSEEKKAKLEEKSGNNETGADRQEDEVAEIEEGIEKAEKDAGTGEDREGKRAEKSQEEITKKDLKEEIEQEKESEVS